MMPPRLAKLAAMQLKELRLLSKAPASVQWQGEKPPERPIERSIATAPKRLLGALNYSRTGKLW